MNIYGFTACPVLYLTTFLYVVVTTYTPCVNFRQCAVSQWISVLHKTYFTVFVPINLWINSHDFSSLTFTFSWIKALDIANIPKGLDSIEYQQR